MKAANNINVKVLFSPEKDPCARNACKHGGTCVDLGGSKVQCSCPVGFKGKTCEGKLKLWFSISTIPVVIHVN